MTRARDVANLIGSGNYSSTTFTATAGQTAFTISHTQGFIQVFMNGLLLDETVDYTSNGSAVTLTSGAAAGDEIEVVAYNTFSVGDALNQAAADTRYVNTSGDTMTGNLTVSGGTVSATGTSTLTNPEADLGLYHSFKNLSSDVNTGVGVSLGSNNNPGATIYAQRTGANNEHKLGFSVRNNSGSSLTRMAIDGTGRVTLPYQAYGEAEGNNSGLLTGFSTGTVINWFTANHLNGGMSFSNNGRFTVPVDGRYLINAQIYYYPGGSHTAYYALDLLKNGNLECFTIDDHVESVSGNIDRTVQLNMMVRASANDYFELRWGSNINGQFWRGAEHNKFRILLLG